MKWQRCLRCGVYYNQENPFDTAELCPDCWKALPHFKIGFLPKPSKGPTHNRTEWEEIRNFFLALLGVTVGLIIIWS